MTDHPLAFLLDELAPLRPTIKNAFGFTHVYVDELLLCSLRFSQKQPSTNGVWLYTTTADGESLAQEFPSLPKRQLWRSGKKAWVVLSVRHPDFEEYVFKACELMVAGDRRIGRLTRGNLNRVSKTTGSPAKKFSLLSPRN